jgi:hypothetical protein
MHMTFPNFPSVMLQNRSLYSSMHMAFPNFPSIMLQIRSLYSSMHMAFPNILSIMLQTVLSTVRYTSLSKTFRQLCYITVLSTVQCIWLSQTFCQLCTEPFSLPSDSHGFPKLSVNYWSHRLFVSILHQLHLVSFYPQSQTQFNVLQVVCLFLPRQISFVHLKMTNALESLERKAQGFCMVHTNCQDPLEKKVMATSGLVIYSTKLMLKLHNVFPNAGGEVLCSRKKNSSLLIFVSSKEKRQFCSFRD